MLGIVFGDCEEGPSYHVSLQLLSELVSLCAGGSEREQTLLRNMGVHTVIFDLLQVPYEKV